MHMALLVVMLVVATGLAIILYTAYRTGDRPRHRAEARRLADEAAIVDNLSASADRNVAPRR